MVDLLQVFPEGSLPGGGIAGPEQLLYKGLKKKKQQNKTL